MESFVDLTTSSPLGSSSPSPSASLSPKIKLSPSANEAIPTVNTIAHASTLKNCNPPDPIDLTTPSGSLSPPADETPPTMDATTRSPTPDVPLPPPKQKYVPQAARKAMASVDNWFPSLQVAYSFLRRHALNEGFAIARLRSSGALPPAIGGGPCRTDYRCEKGLVYKAKAGRTRDYTVSKHDGEKPCAWKAKVTYYSCMESINKWGLTFVEQSHNHCLEGFKDHTLLAPAHRKAVREEYKKEHKMKFIDRVEVFYADNLQSASTIAHLLSKETDVPLLPDNVKWMQTKLRKTKYGAYTATQSFLLELQNSPDIVYWKTENHPVTGRIHRVFWAYKWSVELYKQHPEFLSADNTYNVNRFNMPLFQVGGTTGLHTNFPVAFALTSDEKQGSFEWILTALKDLAEKHEVDPLKSLISDYDQAFKNALSAVFPAVHQQLCRWHIMKNVVHNIKRLWVGQLGDFAGGISENRRIYGDNNTTNEGNLVPEDDVNNDQYAHDEDVDPEAPSDDLEDRLITEAATQPDEHPQRATSSRASTRKFDNTPLGCLQGWKACVYASTEADFNTTWESFQEEFKEQPGKLSLLFFFFY